MKIARFTGWIGLFLLVLGVVFAQQTCVYWHRGSLLAGAQGDAPTHHFLELIQINPCISANDLIVKTVKELGYYENTYRMICWMVRETGLSLLSVNLLLCWAANGLYLLGVFVLLRWMGLSAWICALGTLLAGQYYALLGGIASAMAHTLVIPRDQWVWPLPWLLWWFVARKREKFELVLFYGAMGAVWTMTYPLWAVLCGLVFGLVDVWSSLRSGRYFRLWWLLVAAVVCGAFLFAPSVKMLHLSIFRNQSSVMASQQNVALFAPTPKHSIFWDKSFRRLLIFAIAGVVSFRFLRCDMRGRTETRKLLWQLLVVAMLVCAVHEPLQRLAPVATLLFLGRASLLVYLAVVLAVVLCLEQRFRDFSKWGKTLAVIVLVYWCVYPVQKLCELRRMDRLSVRTDYIEFARMVREKTKAEALLVVPPARDGRFFRVYAERGLWADPDDFICSTEELVAFKRGRVNKLERLYNSSTSSADRERVLGELRAEGVSYVVTQSASPWTASLSWPVLFQHGEWQLRGLPSEASRTGL
jgi:hypothetical protein